MVKYAGRLGISCPSRRDPIKAILEFNLPTDRYEHRLAIDAIKYRSVLWEMSQKLRATLKYQDNPPDYTKACEDIRDWLHNELEAEGLDLYEEG